MKKEKAKNWGIISEGLISETEINNIQNHNAPIVMILDNNIKTHIISIYTFSKTYGIDSGGIPIGKRYKYLSCAVKRAIKEYKTVMRSGNWKMKSK